MNHLIGRTLKDRFVVTALLGEGSMGTVLAGADTTTGDDVAIKVLRPEVMSEPGMLARFRREASVMRRVRHPNVVKVISHGIDEGLAFLVMERATGVSLADLLAVQGQLDPERAARIVADVCDALAESHAHGVFHRDIKPGNIMLSGCGGEVVKLIDFGMAKPRGLRSAQGPDDSGARDSMGPIPDDIDPDDMADLTSAGSVVGSPGYMAPEQWASGTVDERTDVYACGVVLYELVTGVLPFEARNTFEVASMQLRCPPMPPHFINPAVPDALGAVILRALLPSPDARYQTAAQMGRCLRALLDAQSVSSAFGLEKTIPFQIPSVLREDGLLALDRPCFVPELVSPLAAEIDAPDAALPDEASPANDLWAEPADEPELAPLTALDRLSPATIAARRALLAAQIRILLPLSAAFLALGVILGILLFLPTPR